MDRLLLVDIPLVVYVPFLDNPICPANPARFRRDMENMSNDMSKLIWTYLGHIPQYDQVMSKISIAVIEFIPHPITTMGAKKLPKIILHGQTNGK